MTRLPGPRGPGSFFASAFVGSAASRIATIGQPMPRPSGEYYGLFFAGNLPTPLRLLLEPAPPGSAPATIANHGLWRCCGNWLWDRAKSAVLPGTCPQDHGDRSEPRNAPAGGEAHQADEHR